MRAWWLFLLAVAVPAQARDALGVYEGWGAFRDARPPRCYAIAQPVRKSSGLWRLRTGHSNGCVASCKSD
jgi:hypothetical protein